MSSPLDPYIPLLTYLVVWGGIVILAILLKAEKHGILAKPYYLMLKTVHFNSWMERLGNRWRRGWLTIFDIGAAMGIGIMALAIVVMVRSLLLLLFEPARASPTVLIVPIPGVAVRWDIFPYILIAIAAVLIPHEVAHGIASVLDKVPLKSSGVFLAVVLPGGFVEIDEEELAKRKSRTKLRVFAAGSFTNIVTAFLVIMLFVSMFQNTPSGVLVTGLTANGPAEAAGMSQWSVITSVNGTSTPYQANLTRILVLATPGTVLNVTTNHGLYYVRTVAAEGNASRAFMGVSSAPYFASNLPFLSPPWSFHIFNTFQWMEIILLGVGLINMLPLFPFDGDRYFDTILGKLGLKNTRPARTLASVLSLGLLVSNLLFSYTVFGTVLLR